MGFWELVVLAVGLSMDAFAVSICKGLALQRVSWKECCIAGLWFGGFQALMPLLGYLLGTQFEQFVTSVDHWIAFVLLGIIGGNMIREALSKDEDKLDGSLAFKTMLLLAIATSIDALAVGITFAFLPGTRIVPAVALIGSITFVFSAAGIRLGSVFGLRCKRKAEFAGGVILILLGTKILLEHLGCQVAQKLIFQICPYKKHAPSQTRTKRLRRSFVYAETIQTLAFRACGAAFGEHGARRARPGCRGGLV